MMRDISIKLAVGSWQPACPVGRLAILSTQHFANCPLPTASSDEVWDNCGGLKSNTSYQMEL
ncbi:MAG: hypothetical protein JKX73_08385 [Flavobacteriales bacterium]|nr:hypothetical protein [Flavobacteriales bacterium]